MLEKIGTKYYERISLPNQLFLKYIKEYKIDSNKVSVAEIGVGIGATAQAAIQVLDSNDEYYLFDYLDKVEELYNELNCIVHNHPNIICRGNGRSVFDNYVWSLYNMITDRERNGEGLFDLVLLDGAHDYTTDLAACTLIIDLMKYNGLLFLDDVNLNANSIIEYNSLKESELTGYYSSTQLYAFQMKMVCESFLDRHANLNRVVSEDSSIAVYRKI